MFGISFYELIIIMIVALVVLKPKDFVALVVFINKIIKQIKDLLFQVKEEINKVTVLKDFDEYIIIPTEKSKNNNNDVQNKSSYTKEKYSQTNKVTILINDSKDSIQNLIEEDVKVLKDNKEIK